ncbi:polysaccharide biosynthesis protein [Lactobacillus pentosus]|jgi:capsular polysaccharide biosynthesis protein|uniref:Capsular polysaccharide biosynthesis protein CpsC n=1 Tax=Lactiplantibacillus pentosus TaxID=1589 RepID=A0ABD7IN88_LACPE|nr:MULTISPECIES: GNVR domain-containing protein [Lactiplantibacillus]MCH4130829.1 Wzz/FepE/Etk N-terminal domain-containing protein [Lactiplantibacillus sp.]BBM23155.1 polysaccharide biosynthesis protein, chain length regulator [Lactiplantibacillus plantarum]MBU7502416.1 polysaccharide biosynthesis protein [Lactiplantibacillus pentosus]MCJ8181720.1 Wzz/FepE/Etk N-terminal domain-containing protein [Lactiplantibacillus pentosus]MCM8608211.1 Wzz/FepE/Etk N-terminal domain-containing protein [Lac
MEQIITFDFMVKLVRHYWKVLLSLTLLGGLIATVVTLWVVKPQYQANVQILVNRKHSSAGTDLTGQQADVQMITTYKELITNSVVLKPARQDLMDEHGLRRSVNTLKQAVSVTSTANSQVFSIVVRDHNASASAVIANQIATTFKSQVKQIIKVNNVTIVAPAETPDAPVSPKKMINILLGLVMGLLLGLVYASVRILTNRRVQTLEFLTDDLQLTSLGLVNHQPVVATKADNLAAKQRPQTAAKPAIKRV